MAQTISLRALAVLTVTDPAAAARVVLGLDLPREMLWTALLLVSVLNTLLFSLNTMLVGGTAGLPELFQSPAVYFFFVTGGLILIILSIFWTGRAMGGAGNMGDLMALVIWLQFLRVGVQAAVLVLMLAVPLLAALLVLAAAIAGVWILVHFVNAAHGFGSLWRAAGVLIAAFVGMVLGLSLILSLIGVSFVGSAAYV
jgi:hypothetical protein